MIWESYIVNEVIPFIRTHNQHPSLTTAGASFGAFLAVNFAFRHPHIVRKTVGLSGSYSIKRLLEEYYDDDAYFNCPIDYMGNIEDIRLIEALRGMEISLVTSDWDLGLCRERTYDLSRILSQKDIPHKLDDWGGHTIHDWPSWRKMIRHYL
jgi:esterase/lipase superfamily enzyme